MITDKQTREAIYGSFSEKTQGIFAYRKNDIFDNSKAFSLILSMLTLDRGTQKTNSSQEINVLNQAEEDEVGKWLNGVNLSYDPQTGRPVFKEA